MKTHLIICNEADYLQAHLTIIVGKPRPGSQVLHDFKRRVTSRWKKWIGTVNAEVPPQSIQQRGLRETGESQRFEVAARPAVGWTERLR